MNGLTATIMLRASLITMGGLIATRILRAFLLNNRILDVENIDPKVQDGQNEDTTEDPTKDME